MEQEEQKLNSLPDNAYRELKPGEVYKPIMPANSKPREVTTYSVVFGIIMAIVFSAAAAYLGLKVGQVFEAAIPIAIIAVGCGNLMKKNNMLGQNVIVYPDLDMVIVTCAGNNELFQNNVMLDLIRDAFPQEYQASEYALPENPAEYHKLTHLVHSLSHGPSCMPQIRRGGWAKKSGYSRSHAIYPKYVRLLKDLDGKCYNINPASVGLFPLIIQVFHNNLTNGIRQISFQYDKINCPDKFYIHFLEGEEHCTLTASFDCYIDNLITLHGETYLVAVKCEYTTDADHAPVLVLDMVYLEEAMSRKLYLHFKSNELMAHWSESPGKELILEGLSSITGEMTKLPLYGRFLEGSGMQFLEHIMVDTIEPTVHGTLAESDTEDMDI